MKKKQFYEIIRLVKANKNTDDQCCLNPTKTKRTQTLIAAVAAAVENNRRVNINVITSANGVSHGTIFNVLHEDLGLL